MEDAHDLDDIAFDAIEQNVVFDGEAQETWMNVGSCPSNPRVVNQSFENLIDCGIVNLSLLSTPLATCIEVNVARVSLSPLG